MSDLVIFLPRHDYEQKADYDLIESILTSADFNDIGVITIDERTYRRYEIGRGHLLSIPEFGVDLVASTGEQHYLYTENTTDVEVIDKFAAFGLDMVGLVDLGGKVFWQFSVAHSNLPNMAKMARSGIKASRRLIEEMSYFKWLDRGCGCGADWTDWFMSEWEADDRLHETLKAISAGF